MEIEIFSAQLLNGIGKTHDPREQRETAITELRNSVNEFLKKHPGAIVQWLQHSAASNWGSFTQITAVVSY